MKNSHTCPKCNQANIIVVPGWSGAYGSGQYLRMPGLRMFSARVKMDRYVCGDCGYVEEWVKDSEEPEKLNRKMGKA